MKDGGSAAGGRRAHRDLHARDRCGLKPSSRQCLTAGASTVSRLKKALALGHGSICQHPALVLCCDGCEATCTPNAISIAADICNKKKYTCACSRPWQLRPPHAGAGARGQGGG